MNPNTYMCHMNLITHHSTSASGSSHLISVIVFFTCCCYVDLCCHFSSVNV